MSTARALITAAFPVVGSKKIDELKKKFEDLQHESFYSSEEREKGGEIASSDEEGASEEIWTEEEEEGEEEGAREGGEVGEGEMDWDAWARERGEEGEGEMDLNEWARERGEEGEGEMDWKEWVEERLMEWSDQYHTEHEKNISSLKDLIDQYTRLFYRLYRRRFKENQQKDEGFERELGELEEKYSKLMGQSTQYHAEHNKTIGELKEKISSLRDLIDQTVNTYSELRSQFDGYDRTNDGVKQEMENIAEKIDRMNARYEKLVKTLNDAQIPDEQNFHGLLSKDSEGTEYYNLFFRPKDYKSGDTFSKAWRKGKINFQKKM